MQIETGYSFYGQYVGILVFNTITPRIPGDAGHAATFQYPVRYEVVNGSFADLIKDSPKIQNSIIDAGKNLIKQGVRTILSDCGLMSLYQDTLGAKWGIPFVGSALCQIPAVWQIVGRQGEIGVLTGHSGLLGEEHLRNSGWREDIELAIQGLQNESHFEETVLNGGPNIDVEQMRSDVLHATDKLMAKTQNLRAIIIECSNLSTYSADVREHTGVPVFDIVSAANWLEYAVNPKRYVI